MTEPKQIPATKDPNRNQSGRFVRGNQVARKSGLYARCKLNSGEQRRAWRVRKYLREAGLPDDVAASLMILWLSSSRVIESEVAAGPGETIEARAAHFDLIERAGRLQLSVLDRRDRARRGADTPAPEIPLHVQIDQAREEHERGEG